MVIPAHDDLELAGIFASKRKGEECAEVNYTFSEFAVDARQVAETDFDSRSKSTSPEPIDDYSGRNIFREIVVRLNGDVEKAGLMAG